MPWQERQVKVLREEFVQSALKGKKSISSLVEECHISRKTAYKWIKRYLEAGHVEEGSRRPHHQGNKIDAATEAVILNTREQFPYWRARKISAYLSEAGHEMPSFRTVHRVLKRNGAVSSRPFERFEREASNQLWQTDFKGEFVLGDKSICYPLTILDDHSRYALRIEAKTDQRNIITSFTEVFREYGLPDAILSDNALCFHGFRNGYSGFERFLMDQDVLPIHGKAYHPQTQGKIERFHRTLKLELRLSDAISDVREANRLFSEWRRFYNEVRPHGALRHRTPASHYAPSLRPFKEQVEEFVYPGCFRLYKVNNRGYLRFNNHQTYLSDTFINTEVQLVLHEYQNIVHVHYRNFRIAQYDLITGERLMRRASRVVPRL